MRLERALLVFGKDWREVRRNWEVILPITLVPLIFSVIFPAIFFLLPGSVGGSTSTSDFEALIRNMPSNIKAELAGMSSLQVMTYILVLYFFAPFFLIIPVMASSVIASDSFAGEKERKTIEGLLATPLTDGELLLGKILVSFVPSMIVTFLSFTAYCASVDFFGYGLFGRLLLPNLSWLMLVLGLAPVVSLAAIGLTVIVSARVRGFREAQQISVLLILPILGLLFAQAAGVLIFGPTMILILTGLFVVVDIVVFRIGLGLFQREEILSQTR
jgi:ABC-type Na+ efflux pump permease subunit